MARWQRRARLGFGAFAVAFAVVLWLVMGERQAPAPVRSVERLDPEAVSEIKGGDVVQLKGATRDIRVEFATQALYRDGSAKYTGFKAFVDDRGGRSFEISGNEAQVAPNQSAFDVRGDVTVRTSDGLTARTPHARFAEADGLLHGDGPISFERERTRGSGVGFSYDRALDRLELDSQARITVAPDGDTGGMAVSSGNAVHSRAERFMRFDGGMRMERQGQVIEADSATAFLLPDRDEPELVELRGNSRITGAQGTGSLRAMNARDINLRYAGDGRTLEAALLVEQARIQLARADGSPGQQLAGDTVDVQLAPDGAVTNLVAQNDVRVTIPATPGSPARTVQAQALTASGEPGRGLTRMVFQNEVVYREDATKDGDARAVKAQTLNASLAESGTFDEALFSGGFVFDAGRLHAESAEAVYRAAEGTLKLRAPANARQPIVENERFRVNATSIDVTVSPTRLSATGNAQAVFAAGREDRERGNSLLNPEEAVVVVADRLTFDESSGAGEYVGGARILQQQSGNSIRADRIAMNDQTGVLTATGSVVTVLPLAARKDAGTKGNSIGRAAEFEFDDAKRRAVYSKDATLDGAQGTLQANRIELQLATKSNDLQQLTADGAVTVSVEERKATGQRLVYHPDDERYVLNGTPVTLTHGCEQSTGRALTFFRGSDRVSVDGKDVRVQLTGGKCPAPPR